MFLSIRKLLLIAISLGLSACSSGLHVWYNSAPQSAKLICGGQFVGYTPYNAYYNISEGDIQRGYVQVQPCKAVWMGGATDTYRNRFPVNSSSHSYSLTAVSNNVQSVDVQFAGQRDAAYQAQQQQNNQVIQQIYQNRPVNTFCNKIGGQVMCNTY
ncbi:hypothetical protein EXH44_06185 [Actinobacillus indolicus]|uniref:Lipoprotein n=1 Tax=Actinobacillus indolicus TaxID=51049 RepID=A0A4P7CIC2_9PAST|nr:hypothetical protein [Actinobacillus indolicus]QBQ63855.1 hypothetical protein EXH44_06185 [Actinobacillus indolicus]